VSLLFPSLFRMLDESIWQGLPIGEIIAEAMRAGRKNLLTPCRGEDSERLLRGARVTDYDASGENQGTMDWGSPAARCGESSIRRGRPFRPIRRSPRCRPPAMSRRRIQGHRRSSPLLCRETARPTDQDFFSLTAFRERVISLVISTAFLGERYPQILPALSRFMFMVIPAAVWISRVSSMAPALAGGMAS